MHKANIKRLNSIFNAVVNRCYNPLNRRFKDYGGRGIKVYQGWIDNRESFVAWAFQNGYADDLELDREKNDEMYTPDNCRWVTPTINMRNRRNTKTICFKGQYKPLIELCETLNLNYSNAYTALIKRGHDADDYLLRFGNKRLRQKINELCVFYELNK
jgi:hypothetical protein